MIVLRWNLAESKTTLDGLREHLPGLHEGDLWISNDVQERFGIVSTSGELPHLGRLVELIGDEPSMAEEFDAE